MFKKRSHEENGAYAAATSASSSSPSSPPRPPQPLPFSLGPIPSSAVIDLTMEEERKEVVQVDLPPLSFKISKLGKDAWQLIFDALPWQEVVLNVLCVSVEWNRDVVAGKAASLHQVLKCSVWEARIAGHNLHQLMLSSARHWIGELRLPLSLPLDPALSLQLHYSMPNLRILSCTCFLPDADPTKWSRFAFPARMQKLFITVSQHTTRKPWALTVISSRIATFHHSLQLLLLDLCQSKSGFLQTVLIGVFQEESASQPPSVAALEPLKRLPNLTNFTWYTVDPTLAQWPQPQMDVIRSLSSLRRFKLASLGPHVNTQSITLD